MPTPKEHKTVQARILAYAEAIGKLRQEADVAFGSLSKLRHECALATVPYALEIAKDALESEPKIAVWAHHRDVVEKVRELTPGHGLDAATGEYVDMIAAGIIDPAKVTRSALQNAASIAGLFLTTEVVVADKPEKAAPAMPGGDMGGMDF